MPPEHKREQGHPVLATDLLHRVHGLDDRLAVGVQAPVGVPGIGIAPGDDEDLLSAAHQVLDQAALLGEVDDVVLVDRRRHDEQRHPAHLRRLGGVLDQLEHVGAEHDRARGHRQVGADLERVRLDHRGHPWCGGEVARETTAAVDQVASAGVDDRLEHRGVEQRAVAGGRRLDQVVDDEPHPLVVAPVEVGVVDQATRCRSHRQVGLQCPAEQRVVGPARVGEAPVLLVRRELGTAQADPRQLTGQVAGPPHDPARAPGQVRGEAQTRDTGQEPAQRVEGSVGEQQVEWGRRIGASRRRPRAPVALPCWRRS